MEDTIMSNQQSIGYPNETIKLLHERGSVRSYLDKPIEPEILDAVLKAGIHAPTGGNLQSYSIIKIENKETMGKLAKLCWQDFIGEAAVDLIFCIDHRRHKRLADIGVAPHTTYHSFRHFWVSFQDTIIAAQNICTAADALGLGSCYIGTILEHFEKIIEMCEIPEGVFPVVLLCLGYPKTKPKVTNKFGLEIMVHDETYADIPDENLFVAYTERENHRQLEFTDERLSRIRNVCTRAHGEAFAEHCVGTIKRNGYINPVQYRFGLHYEADEMAMGNTDFLSILEKMGFDWFKEWHPYEE
jgi:FMN reductase [NAD(P)H]